MSSRFWWVAAVHHVFVVVVTLLLARRWARRASSGPGAGDPLVGLLGVLGVLSAAAAASAWLASGALPDRMFALSRLVAQVAFGEVLVLLVWATVWLASRRTRAAALATGFAALLLLGVYVEAYHLEPRRLVVQRHDVPVAGPMRPLRIVHLSDIQAWKAGEFERSVLREAMREVPDLVFLTGDYVQSRFTETKQDDIETLRRLFREEGVAARLGVFAVWGNCDRESRQLFDGLAVRVLENEVARVELPGGGTLAVVGLEWRTSMSPGGRELARLFRQVKPADHRIVLGHAPDYAEEVAASYDVDLLLAGHTHGGQVALPLFGPPVTLSLAPRRVAAGGLTEVGGIPVNVSRGTGMERGSAPQVRFLCPPEFSVLELVAGPRAASSRDTRRGS